VNAVSRRTAGLLLGVILLVAFGLRVWHLRHGLPFAYNADEAEHFVPKAIGMFSDGLDPGYYENPSALTYLLYLVFKVRYTAGFPFGGGIIAGAESVFFTARFVVALIGTLVVFLTFWAGLRFADRRTGLVAAAVMAVAFLPVFYSKHALNDVVTLAPVTLGLVGSVFAFRSGRIEHWLLAGGAVGAATATKYTAGAMLLTVVLAAALRVQQDRTELRRALLGVVVAGVACLVVFALLNPFVVLHPSEARGQITGQSAQADTAKLGQDDTYGWLYYLGTLTWGLGWAPLLAAVAGAVVILRRDWRLGLLLVAFPVCFYLYMGAQGRFFGRWLLPIYPALCVLAGIAAVAAVDLLRRHRGWALAALTAVLCVQGLLASVHVDAVLGREDTRAEALRWVRENVPPGAPLVVEPFVPASWQDALQRPLWPVPRPFQAYEKRLRVRQLDAFRRKGFCWVIVGSTQKERGLKAGLTSSRNFYRVLDAASEETVRFSPFKAGADGPGFSYDSSFNYRPRDFERPGPVVEIHRLRDCTPAVG